MKYKWAVVADLIRMLSNVSSSKLGLNDTEVENSLNDVACIMDTMMTHKCGFDKAVKIERESDNVFAEWLEEALQEINYEVGSKI